jgi:dsRNA-specific ribonuclease
MKKYSRNGKTIVFYQKENDEKFSFLIENEPELTNQLLANVSTKRVKEKDIRFAVKGIFEKIENNLLTIKKLNEMEKNPIIELAEFVQYKYGANIETRVTNKTGADHCPIITVEIELPNGLIIEASGKNKKEAKQKAAEIALKGFGKN